MHNTSHLSKTVARFAAGLVLVLAGPALAEVYSYECGSLPERAGWTLFQAFCGPQQWVDDGTLVQQVLMCKEFPGQSPMILFPVDILISFHLEWVTTKDRTQFEIKRCTGQQFDYFRDIENLEGLTSWFAEWRMMTTGISEELIYVAPASFVLNNGGGLVYHFSIADDRVRFIRDFSFPVLYFDIDPGQFHTFRVEIFAQNLGETYVVYIDGAVVDSGLVEGPFYNPPWQADIKFRAKAKLVPSVTTWDYIRWGPFPTGFDFTGDGVVGGDDLYFFQECFSDPQGAGSWVGCAWADSDASGLVDCSDFEAFVAAWTDPADPPVVVECVCSMADMNDSSAVDAADLALLLGAWGPNPTHPADLNGNDTVNASDLALLLGAWGPCD